MICIILVTSYGYERQISSFLKSAPLKWPRFLKVAFIGRHLKSSSFYQRALFISYLPLAQFVIPLRESEILEELPVHAVLAGVTMGLGLFDAVAVVLPVLIVMRIIL